MVQFEKFLVVKVDVIIFSLVSDDIFEFMQCKVVEFGILLVYVNWMLFQNCFFGVVLLISCNEIVVGWLQGCLFVLMVGGQGNFVLLFGFKGYLVVEICSQGVWEVI